MKKSYSAFYGIVSALMLFVSFTAKADNLRFAESPVLSPDASQIYFSYCGDIYRVPVTGGTAVCVVNAGGVETKPKISPDGKFLAFASDVQGNNDVYVVPVAGGRVRQLTYHQGADTPSGWSPDSKYVYFESARASATVTTYRVSIDGGTPERLFHGYFNTVSSLVQSPKDGKYYFNVSTEAINFPTRKRYIGDHNPDIQCWDESRQEYSRLTSYEGKDLWPMVDSQGTLYYVTDQWGKESNIARHSQDGPVQLTFFGKSVMYPSISYDGSKIVFLMEYEMNVLDIASGKVAKPQVDLSNSSFELRKSFAAQKPSAAAVSPDDKKLALAIRGMLYISDIKGEYLKKLETPADERVTKVIWGEDSKTVYYLRTNKGWTNLYRIAADGSSGEQPVFTPECSVTSLTASHSGKLMAFASGNRDIYIGKTGSGTVEKVAEAQIWSYMSHCFDFSFDDKFLAFDAINMFEPEIYIYDIEAAKLKNLTNSASVEETPRFSADGHNLYFQGNILSASFPRGASSGNNIYRLPLRKYDRPFKSDSYTELFAKAPAKDSTIRIDYSDIFDRVEIEASNSSSPYIFKTKAKEYGFCTQRKDGKAVLMVRELSDSKAKPKEVSGFTGGTFFHSKDNLYCITRAGDIYKVDPASAKGTKIDIEANVDKTLQDEFSQMFYEAWAALDQNYYDVKFHDADWRGVRDYYSRFLPHIRNRRQLRTMMADMLGELNSSHQGFYSTGKEETTATNTYTLETGIVFSNDRPYVVDHIVKNSPADKIEVNIKQGDELVAVNGVRVDKKENRERYFSAVEMSEEVELKLVRNGKEFVQKVHTQQNSELKSLLYAEWEDAAKAGVDKATDGKVAYIHMRAMGTDDLNDFLKKMHTYAVHKDALILDLRYNNGGNVHKEVLDFLRGQEHFRWSYRDFEPVSHPNVAPAGKPIVVLVNERSLSDAEVTSNGIKNLGIAPIVGTETYRWIIFTSSVSLIDGSLCRLPAWGCYNLDGSDLEFSGVKPDYYVRNTFEDRHKGRDPQLDKAIELIQQQLKK